MVQCWLRPWCCLRDYFDLIDLALLATHCLFMIAQLMSNSDSYFAADGRQILARDELDLSSKDKKMRKFDERVCCFHQYLILKSCPSCSHDIFAALYLCSCLWINTHVRLVRD